MENLPSLASLFARVFGFTLLVLIAAAVCRPAAPLFSRLRAYFSKSARLLRAAKVGNAAAVRRLLAAGADVNTQDAGAWTPLLWAAQQGHAAVLRLLLENTAHYLPQQRVLIAGYGNVGQETARWLCGVGCRCTVAARRDAQRTAAKTAGCDAITPDEAKRTIGRFDVLVNTIPARWLDAKSLSGAKPGGIYLELASAPFGTEKDDAEQHGLRFLDGRGLPGRFCPLAAAEAMKVCIDAT